MPSFAHFCAVQEVTLEHSFAGVLFELHPLRALWSPEHATIICSDIHVGKASHFRKHGVALPSAINDQNAWNLSQLLQRYNPSELIVVGDLIHHDANGEWVAFIDFLDHWPHMKRTLIAGNHDRRGLSEAGRAGFDVVAIGQFAGIGLAHIPEDAPSHLPCIAGHVHPAIRLSGKAKQSLRVPCFLFSEKLALLPAFGAFTGTSVVRPKPGDHVYAIAGQRIVPIHNTRE
jgi:uncharacterized protein